MVEKDQQLGYRIEPLNEHNWASYSRRLIAVTDELGLTKYITGDAKKPPIAPTSTSGEPLSQSEIKKYEKALADWEAGQLRAKNRIMLSLTDSQMDLITDCNTAAEIWDRLIELKEPRGRFGIVVTRRLLHQTEVKEGFDPTKHIAKLCKLQSNLTRMGHNVSDEEFTMILLTSVPESWDNITSTYLTSNPDNIMTSSIVAMILEEDQRRKSRDGGGSSSSLVAWNSKSGSTSQGGSEKTEKECYNCKKKGHIRRDCWAKGGGKEGQKPKG